MDDQQIKNDLVHTMLRKKLVGSNKITVQKLVGYAVQPHEEGRAKELLDDLVQAGVVERYGGGQRENVRLSSSAIAVQYLKDNGGDVPFTFR